MPMLQMNGQCRRQCHVILPPLPHHLNGAHVVMIPRTYEYITINISKEDFDVVIKVRTLRWEETVVRVI